jgi:Putative transmembrane protein (PGPGW)
LFSAGRGDRLFVIRQSLTPALIALAFPNGTFPSSDRTGLSHSWRTVLNRILENKPYKIVRKIVIAIVGVSVILIGAAMIFLPGPAIVVIPVGLAILATEFAWAKVLLHKLKEKIPWKTTAKVF